LFRAHDGTVVSTSPIFIRPNLYKQRQTELSGITNTTSLTELLLLCRNPGCAAIFSSGRHRSRVIEILRHDMHAIPIPLITRQEREGRGLSVLRGGAREILDIFGFSSGRAS